MATKFGTKLAITRLVYEISARFLRLYGGFGDGPANAANRILPRLTLVAMKTKFGTKLAITRHNVGLRDISEILVFNKGFLGWNK